MRKASKRRTFVDGLFGSDNFSSKPKILVSGEKRNTLESSENDYGLAR